MRVLLALLLLSMLPVAAMQAKADEEEDAPRYARSGPGATTLPLPRFVSLGTEKANLRAGPGQRFPIVWVMQRKALPVMVVAEFDLWRKIRDADGAEGWLHKSLLSGRRFGMVTGGVRVLRTEARPDAPGVAQLEPGVIGQLAACRPGWCRMKAGSFDGWLEVEAFYGALADETFD